MTDHDFFELCDLIEPEEFDIEAERYYKSLNVAAYSYEQVWHESGGRQGFADWVSERADDLWPEACFNRFNYHGKIVRNPNYAISYTLSHNMTMRLNAFRIAKLIRSKDFVTHLDLNKALYPEAPRYWNDYKPYAVTDKAGATRRKRNEADQLGYPSSKFYNFLEYYGA